MIDSPTPDGIRIAKRLARAGVASRREAERMIEAGRVKVNGRRIDSPALNVTGRDRIEVDGKLSVLGLDVRRRRHLHRAEPGLHVRERWHL